MEPLDETTTIAELEEGALVLPCPFPLEESDRFATFLDEGQESLLLQDSSTEAQVTRKLLISTIAQLRIGIEGWNWCH